MSLLQLTDSIENPVTKKIEFVKEILDAGLQIRAKLSPEALCYKIRLRNGGCVMGDYAFAMKLLDRALQYAK